MFDVPVKGSIFGFRPSKIFFWGFWSMQILKLPIFVTIVYRHLKNHDMADRSLGHPRHVI